MSFVCQISRTLPFTSSCSGQTTTNADDLADCDLIIEAVPEKLELKQAVFESLDKVCKPSCIFTSNTSGLVIEDIVAKCSPERQLISAGSA